MKNLDPDRECFFCEHFTEQTDDEQEADSFECGKSRFRITADYPTGLAETCPDFQLNDRPGSHWDLMQDLQKALG